MDPRKLQHLIALADHGTVARASAAVHLTQPGLSRSLQALQDEVRVPLLERRGRGVVLTPYGQLLVEHGRRLLADQAEALRAIESLREGHGGTLAIGLETSVVPLLLSTLVSGFSTERPSVRLRLREGTTEAMLAELRAERLDVIVGDGRVLGAEAGLALERLPDVCGAIACRPGHPVLDEPVVTIEMLARFPFGSSAWAGSFVADARERFGEVAHPAQLVTVRCDNALALIEAARSSDLLVGLPTYSFREAIALGVLVPVLVPGLEQLVVKTAIATAAGRAPSPLVEAFSRYTRSAPWR